MGSLFFFVGRSSGEWPPCDFGGGKDANSPDDDPLCDFGAGRDANNPDFFTAAGKETLGCKSLKPVNQDCVVRTSFRYTGT